MCIFCVKNRIRSIGIERIMRMLIIENFRKCKEIGFVVIVYIYYVENKFI